MNGWTFVSVWNVLRKHDEWTRPYKGWISDLALHHSGLEFYMDSNGIRFRVENKVVYEPCLFAWVLFHWPVWRLRRSLSNAAPDLTADQGCSVEGLVSRSDVSVQKLRKDVLS